MNISQPLEFVLNGRRISAGSVAVQTTLLDYLRAQGLTGAKEGCAEGECGACAVVVVSARNGGGEYRAINSCLMFAPMAAGREVYTVESLAAEGELAECQKAMAAAGGSQCGYCTPGFIMSLFAEQYRPGRSGPCDPHRLGGNLCRCTGYRPIGDAARSLGPAPAGAFLDRLAQPVPPLNAVDYRADHGTEQSRFSRPATLGECFNILAAHPGARVIAGATDLAVESNLRGRRWGHLVSVEAIDELRGFSQTPASVLIGAALPLTDAGERWSEPPRAVGQWLPLFASPLIRNRATLGGNLATASPIGDAAPLMMSLDASVHVAGAKGRRQIPLQSFFTAYRKTSLTPGELLAAIEIPKPFPVFTRFYKVVKRRMDDISTVAAGMAIDVDRLGRVERARIALGGVAPTPIRALAAEEALIGQPWNEAAVERAQSALDRTLQPISDQRGSAGYRLAVAKSLIAKFLWEWQREAV